MRAAAAAGLLLLLLAQPDLLAAVLLAPPVDALKALSDWHCHVNLFCLRQKLPAEQQVVPQIASLLHMFRPPQML